MENMNTIKKVLITFQLHTESCPLSPDHRTGDAIHPVLRAGLRWGLTLIGALMQRVQSKVVRHYYVLLYISQ
jgi:hypothetical protein